MGFDCDRVQYFLQSPLLSLEPEGLALGEQSAVADRAPASPFPTALTLHWFESVASTNTTAWELLRQTGAGAVAIAATQQAGRGQWGHAWQSPLGGLYLSLGLLPNLPVADAALLTLGSTWGVAKRLQQHGVPVTIKWLNDLVVQGRKLGGILTETRLQRDRIHQAVVGIGLNWCNLTPAIGINLQTVLGASLGSEPVTTGVTHASAAPITDLEHLAAIVLQGLQLGYQTWWTAGGETLRRYYTELLYHRGRSVQINGVPGIVTAITVTGHLRVWLQPAHQSPHWLDLAPGDWSLGYGEGGRASG